MIGTTELVSWQQIESLGRIEGSDWVSPQGSISELGKIQDQGEVITDDDIRVFADGHDQHLELVKFPEGFNAARIIDSETGRALTTEGASKKYGGIFKCNCGKIHAPCVMGVLSDSPLRLASNHWLTGVSNYEDGTETYIKQATAGTSLDDIAPTQTRLRIVPANRDLYLVADGKTQHDAVNASLDIRQRQDKINASLALWVSDGYNHLGQVIFELGADGQAVAVKVFKQGLLKRLGIAPDLVELNKTSEWGKVTDPVAQNRVLDATAEMIGWNIWPGLDLKTTAANVYQAMGQTSLDPLSLLEPNRA